jgi:hypothetical protein
MEISLDWASPLVTTGAMIPYAKKTPQPPEFELRPGDVVCLAGNRPGNVPFEHVAIVKISEPLSIDSFEKLAGVEVCGYPEMGSDSDDGFIKTVTGVFWRNHPNVRNGDIGCIRGAWNLIGRIEGINESYISSQMEWIYGYFKPAQFRPSQPQKFRIIDFRQAHTVIDTNCLGWVCSVLGLMPGVAFRLPFPTYKSPYTARFASGTRDYPSPGHFFFVVGSAPKYPYRPASPTEAENLATAAYILQGL